MKDTPIPFTADDLARLMALEHMVTTLWSFYAFAQAGPAGLGNEAVARKLSEGVQGTIVDAGMPTEVRDLVREHVRGLMDRVIENGRTADELSGG